MAFFAGIIFFVMIFFAIIGIILLVFSFVSFKRQKIVLAIILAIFGLILFISSVGFMIFAIFSSTSSI
jgi:hypothetical protein